MHVLQFQTIRNRGAVAVTTRRISFVLTATRQLSGWERRGPYFFVLLISNVRGELQLNASAPDHTSIFQPHSAKKWISGAYLGDVFDH